MSNSQEEKHLDVYENRYELHQEGETTVYYQGFQNEATQDRYKLIIQTLASGYLESKINTLNEKDFSGLSENNKQLLNNMVNGVTSEAGRALVGLVFLQLTIKSIAPDQSIRLHKGTTRRGSFSWVDGISMRSIDSTYNTPFLREKGLLNLNRYGSFMTRSLAENYPYTNLYKADMRGPFNDWIAIVDAIEDNTMPAELGLSFLMALLKNRSNQFQQKSELMCQLLANWSNKSFDQIKNVISTFFNSTEYSARAFEVSMHSLLQAMKEMNLLGDADVVPLSQMRSANKKHGNIGDVELIENGVVFESWDAKYGKPYLRDELEELKDKLLTHPECRLAGFVVNSAIDFRKDIKSRKNELEMETATEIHLFSFDAWVDFEIRNLNLNSNQMDTLAFGWLKALVETFARKRLNLAPIDEPCEAWVDDLIRILGT